MCDGLAEWYFFDFVGGGFDVYFFVCGFLFGIGYYVPLVVVLLLVILLVCLIRYLLMALCIIVVDLI